MLYSSSPIEALQRASEVLSDYWELVTKSDVPLDWRCQHEYTESFGSSTELSTEPSTEYFTGESLLLLENSLMDLKISSEFPDVQITKTKSISFQTESYGRKSAKSYHKNPVRDLYQLGFIIASVCGGLLFILTLYCLITQKVHVHLLHYHPNLTCSYEVSGHAFQSYCNKARLGSFCMSPPGHFLSSNY